MKKLMDIWAKISSIIIILLFIFVIIYSEIPSKEDFYGSLFSPLILIFVFGFYTICFFVPLFYFAWSKKKKNGLMRIWAKISAVLECLFIILNLVLYLGDKIEYCPYCDIYISSMPFFLLILIIPLFYYGWKSNK
jgi:heme/copper-type cytochrome/quinol oxidase subunit 4